MKCPKRECFAYLRANETRRGRRSAFWPTAAPERRLCFIPFGGTATHDFAEAVRSQNERNFLCVYCAPRMLKGGENTRILAEENGITN